MGVPERSMPIHHSPEGMIHMPEKPEYVKNYAKQRNEEVKCINGHWYLYEREPYYNKEKGQTRRKSGRIIGKLTPDGLVPSKHRTSKGVPVVETAAGARIPRGSPIEMNGTHTGALNTDFIHGVVVPMLTPIDSEERIDEPRFRAQVEYIIQGGLHGILVFGSNGEFYQVEEDEMERGLKLAVDQANERIPVYFGIGAINTKKCVRLAQMAAANGAAAISILQPMFLKPTQEELYLHFKAIAEAVPNTPVLLYNNPGRVGYGLTADLIERLAHTVPNIVGMKDTSGDMTLTEECVRRNRDVGFKVFGGKDTLLYCSLCVGAVGGVCTAGNFMPELIGDIYNKFMAGDLQGALEAQFKLNPVRLSMDAASFPVAAKDMAKLRGLDVGDPYRPNLPTPEGPVLEKIRKAMTDAGLL